MNPRFTYFYLLYAQTDGRTNCRSRPRSTQHRAVKSQVGNLVGKYVSQSVSREFIQRIKCDASNALYVLNTLKTTEF